MSTKEIKKAPIVTIGAVYFTLRCECAGQRELRITAETTATGRVITTRTTAFTTLAAEATTITTTTFTTFAAEITTAFTTFATEATTTAATFAARVRNRITQQLHIHRLVQNAGTREVLEHFARHTFRQLDGGVRREQLNVANVTAADVAFVSDSAHDMTNFNAVITAHFNAV